MRNRLTAPLTLLAALVAMLGLLVVPSAFHTVAAKPAAEDIPIGVFTGAKYDGWTVEGKAFQPGPVTTGDMLKRLEIEGAQLGGQPGLF